MGLMNPVEEVKGNEGRRWRIWTQRTTYLVDLDAVTITRNPGPNSSPSINDCERPLRSLDKCRVGATGYWTMRAGTDADSVEYFWQFCTEIRRIEKLQGSRSVARIGTRRAVSPAAYSVDG